MKLYRHPLSGCSHRALLFLSLLELEAELITVDLVSGENRGEEYLKIHPLGTVPVLEDDGALVRDSHAILVYLARRYADTSWLPQEPLLEAEIQAWLARSSRDWMEGPAYARLGVLFKRPVDVEAAQSKTRRLFDAFERHLEGREWIVTDHPTIADVAAYPYTATAPEGDVALDGWPRIQAWLGRVEGLPGFVRMPTLAEVMAASAGSR